MLFVILQVVIAAHLRSINAAVFGEDAGNIVHSSPSTNFDAGGSLIGYSGASWQCLPANVCCGRITTRFVNHEDDNETP
jgi:hypothetical protein